MSELFKEEDFYKDNGGPTEEYTHCSYTVPVLNERVDENDYDQFALIENALYPYIRLTKRRGNSHFPCGGCLSPATDGFFARKTEQERDALCPKIAWGFAAVFVSELDYDCRQKDYVPRKDRNSLIQSYYSKYLQQYLQYHNGLKFLNVSKEQKELDFLGEHERIIRLLWEKSEPLKRYSELYRYAADAEADYERFLEGRRNELLNKIKEVPHSLDVDAKKSRSIIQNGEKSVYVENNTGTIIIGSEPSDNSGKLKVHNEAYFADIEQRILKALDDASATIDLCVAWFTNDKLRDKLLEKSKEGIEVRVIIYKDGVNKSKGVDLTGLNHKEYRGERGGVEHHKFCVIDNVHTISGSYNWTLNAEHKNDEDATFHFEDYKLASTFTRRFNEIWRRDGKTE